ncbi:MAG: sigma factor, partial [Planctomycetota bacterium]
MVSSWSLGCGNHLNNAELIEGLKRHDADAAKYLHQCFTPSLWRFVYVRVDRDLHLAEDIVSESVLALIAAIERGIEIEFPGAWLRQVATRRIQDHFRAVARVRHLMETTSQSPDQHVQQSTP